MPLMDLRMFAAQLITNNASLLERYTFYLGAVINIMSRHNPRYTL